MKKQKQDGEGQDVPTDHTKTKPYRTASKPQEALKRLFRNYEDRAFELFLEYVRAKK